MPHITMPTTAPNTSIEAVSYFPSWGRSTATIAAAIALSAAAPWWLSENLFSMRQPMPRCSRRKALLDT